MENDTGMRRADEMERRRRKAKFVRRVKIKKICAAAVLFLMFAGICLAVFGIGFGIYKFISSRKMVEEPYSAANMTNIVLVENVFTETYRLADGFDSDEYTDDEYYNEFIRLAAEDQDPSTLNNGGQSTARVGSESEKYTPGKKALVVVDAGHGGKDSGAVSENELYEKNMVLSIALYTREELIKKGYGVYMSRTDDTFVGLNARAQKANELGADVFVSIHLNSYPQAESVAGVEAWTYDREGNPEFAEILAEHVSEAMNSRNRGVSFAKNLVVTSKTNMPSVIIECGYITNKEELLKLNSAEYQQSVAKAIAEAVDEFLN
ncbi:MAG: N-acetylmuramoyl-L-alanine amidase [Lachnospiraceae bacterium]|nr:N-acetylmuramoyl-L-alanine amidase [Lachnospiraceae bacterium]